MVNILANAVSYTNRGSIELGFHSTDNGYNFYIKDTGVGISEDFKKIIFNKFEKGENSNGTGLGLSIAKSIVTKLGGKIGVISSEGKGSTFWFTLK